MWRDSKRSSVCVWQNYQPWVCSFLFFYQSPQLSCLVHQFNCLQRSYKSMASATWHGSAWDHVMGTTPGSPTTSERTSAPEAPGRCTMRSEYQNKRDFRGWETVAAVSSVGLRFQWPAWGSVDRPWASSGFIHGVFPDRVLLENCWRAYGFVARLSNFLLGILEPEGRERELKYWL